MFTHLDDPSPPAADPQLIVGAVTEGRRRLRRRQRLLGGSVVAVMLVAAATVGMLRWADTDTSNVVAGEDLAEANTELAVPPVGEVVADKLTDGTPVWVVHHQDGEITVLDAASTHTPYGVSHLVGWCAAARVFIDPQGGSQYDDRGRKFAGPAPYGLNVLTAAPIDGRVVVHGRSAFRRAPGETEGGNRADGEVCLSLERRLGFHPRTLVFHDIADWHALILEALDGDWRGEFVLVQDAPIVIDEERGAVACSDADDVFASSPRSCDGIPAPDLGLPDGQNRAVLRGTFLARIDDGGFHDIIYVRGWAVTPIGEDGAVDDGEGDPDPCLASAIDLVVATSQSTYDVGARVVITSTATNRAGRDCPEGSSFTFEIADADGRVVFSLMAAASRLPGAPPWRAGESRGEELLWEQQANADGKQVSPGEYTVTYEVTAGEVFSESATYSASATFSIVDSSDEATP